MTEPIGDTLRFIIGSTGDCDHLGLARYVSVLLYLLVLVAGLLLEIFFTVSLTLGFTSCWVRCLHSPARLSW